jgi:hypothetical protein
VVSATAENGRFRFIHWMPMRNLMGYSSATSGRCTLGGAEQGVDDALYDVALCWAPVPTADPAFVGDPAPRRPRRGVACAASGD